MPTRSAWPWSSDDPRISSLDVIGNDPRTASADIGRSLVTHAINESAGILTRLATTELREDSWSSDATHR